MRVIERLKKGMKLLIEEKGSLRERISELELIRIKFEGLVEIERQEREKLVRDLRRMSKVSRDQ